MSLAARNSSASVMRALAAATGVVLIRDLALAFPKPTPSGARVRGLLRVLTDPRVWLFGLLLFFESGNENCMFVWTGKITADILNLVPKRADLALVGLSAAVGAGRLLAVAGLKRLSGRALLLSSAAVTVGGALVVLALESFAGMVAGFAVMGLGMSAIFPTALGLAVVFRKGEISTSGSG